MKNILYIVLISILLSGCFGNTKIERSEPAVLRTSVIELTSTAIVIDTNDGAWVAKKNVDTAYQLLFVGYEINENTIISLKPGAVIRIQTENNKVIELNGGDSEDWYTFSLSN